MRAAAVCCVLRLLLARLLFSGEAHAVLCNFCDNVRHIMVLYSIGIVVRDLLIAHGLRVLEQTRMSVCVVLTRLLSPVH